MKLPKLIALVALLLGAILVLSGRGLPFASLIAGAFGGSGSSSPSALPEGELLASPGIALTGGGSGNVRSVASFFEVTAETETPAAAVELAEMTGCSFRRPRTGELIGNVHVGRGGMPVPVAARSRRELAGLTLARMRALRAGTPPETLTDPEPMRAVDVFVTERSRPVYLILQNDTGDVLWNIQPAPGARIAHVAVIAAGQAALYLPGNARVEVLRVAEHPDCALAPLRQPDPEWRVFREGLRFEERQAAFEAYDSWFRERFGIGAEANVAGFHETSHVLVGPEPKPHEKVMQNRLAGATIAVTDAPLAALGGADARKGHTAAAVGRLMAAAAGGSDAATLVFRTVERAEGTP